MPNIGCTEVRKGMIVHFEGKLQYVMNVYHHTPGNLRAVIQIKMRDLKSGNSKETRFGSGDKLDVVHIEQIDMEYLYQDGESSSFFDTANSYVGGVSETLLGEDSQWLKENTVCKVELYEGSAIAVEVPFTVELKVVETEPSLKGATITNVYKAAKLETGATVQVPPFIEIGEMIRVDTREAKYLERVNK